MLLKKLLLLGLASGFAVISALAETVAGGRNRIDNPLFPRIELQTASVATRYNFVADNRGVTTQNQQQHKETFRFRLFIDRAAQYTLHAAAGSGSGFTSGWDGLGLGNDAVSNLNLRELYLSLKPFKGLELQYGGIAPNRGIATEITTYDNDAYLIGSRITLKNPKWLFFDEITATLAFLGDLNEPDVFRRFNRSDQANYQQILVSKRIGNRVVLSGDYVSQWGIATLHQAVQAKMPELKIIDSLRYENYQRLEGHADYGFALQGDRRIRPWLSAAGGYADIDRHYGGLNADRFNKGRRLFAHARIDPAKSLSFEAFIQKAMANPYPIANDVRLDLTLTYDLLPGISKLGIFQIPD